MCGGGGELEAGGQTVQTPHPHPGYDKCPPGIRYTRLTLLCSTQGGCRETQSPELSSQVLLSSVFSFYCVYRRRRMLVEPIVAALRYL